MRHGIFALPPFGPPFFSRTPYWRPNFYATLPHRTIFAKLPFLKNITVKHLSYQNVYAFIERINFFNFWMFVFVREQLATKKLWPLHRLSWSGGGDTVFENCEMGLKKLWNWERRQKKLRNCELKRSCDLRKGPKISCELWNQAKNGWEIWELWNRDIFTTISI